MKRRWLFAIGLPLALIAGYNLLYPTYNWRQKMTLEVQVGEQVHSASSVSEMRAVFVPKILPDAPPLQLEFRGEAVVLDIPNRGKLFALLSGTSSSEYSKYIATNVFGDVLPRGSARARFSTLTRLRETREVPRDHYPVLVTFTDINDPTTVHRVDPVDLAATFGPGVSLKRITLEVTDGEVTEGRVEQVLPCLRSGKACVPLNTDLPYGDPMRNILNHMFWRR